MAREARIEYAGAPYHVLDRGGRRVLEEAVEKTARRTHRGGSAEKAYEIEERRRIMAKGPVGVRLDAEELPDLPKGDPRKAVIAANHSGSNPVEGEALKLRRLSRGSLLRERTSRRKTCKAASLPARNRQRASRADPYDFDEVVIQKVNVVDGSIP